MHGYVTSPFGLNVPSNHILDLFDSDEPASEQLARAADWLIKLQTRSEHSIDADSDRASSPTWLLVYYVGHGAFWNESEYFLVTATTRSHLEPATSIRLVDLASVIGAFSGRRIMVLDACYAAAALRYLQGGEPDTRVYATAKATFPSYGTLLLAASSADTPAEAPEELPTTMFAYALLAVLSGRYPPSKGSSITYSTREVHRLSLAYLEGRFGNRRVDPQLHEPIQEGAGLADLPLFPIVRRADDLVSLLKNVAEMELGLFDARKTLGTATRFGTLPHLRRLVYFFLPLLLVLSIAALLLALRHPPAIAASHQRTIAGPPIALISDFGAKGYYIGAVKGKILALYPNAVIIDITHEITPLDTLEAAWKLWLASRSFPPGTIFVILINPGGLSTSQQVVLETKNSQIYVGHDNGVFDFVAEQYGIRSEYVIAGKDVTPATFRDGGLDYFAPVAAKLASGTPLKEFGTQIAEYDQKLPKITHYVHTGEPLMGSVIDIDSFGNVSLNLSAQDINVLGVRRKDLLQIEIHGKSVSIVFEETYSRVAEGAPVAILNDGYLQLAVNGGNFFKNLEPQLGKLERRTPISVKKVSGP